MLLVTCIATLAGGARMRQSKRPSSHVLAGRGCASDLPPKRPSTGWRVSSRAAPLGEALSRVERREWLALEGKRLAPVEGEPT
eukprot:1975818-Amphidinium_carterae.1